MGPPYAEDELLPLSALQHLLFCERQCALIHVEGIWAENKLTMEGRHLHERADSGESELRGHVRTVRSLPIRSMQLGLSGRADVVEFQYDSAGMLVSVTPIEYKRGKPKSDHSDEVQLCAQALSLEEMLGVTISAGALFYGRPRRRFDVVFTAGLRALTTASATRLHALIMSGITPSAAYGPRCDNCSLIDLCMPGVTGAKRSAAAYVDRALGAALQAAPVIEEP